MDFSKTDCVLNFYSIFCTERLSHAVSSSESVSIYVFPFFLSTIKLPFYPNIHNGIWHNATKYKAILQENRKSFHTKFTFPALLLC